MHVASVHDPDNYPMRAPKEFNNFTAGVRDRCDAPRVTSVMHQVGTYSGPFVLR